MLSSSFAEQRRAKGAAAAAVAAAQVSPARIVLSSSSSEDDTGTHESYQPDLTGYAASTMEGAIVGYELAGASDSISYELPPENPSSPTPGTRPLLVRQGTGLGEPHVKDWQRRHESAQLVTCDRHRIEALSLLAQEFSFMAQMYAEVICVERDLPVAEKTIKPATQMGGVAGGEKYLAGNILFKFCEDHQFSNGSYLYGGDRPFDEAAAKGAGQERKALQAVQQHFGIRSASDVIYTPLFATVDFRGFRLSCQSLITGISGATLVVGSKDGGHHIAVPGSDDRRTHDIVSELGRALNLAPHRVLERSSGAVHEIALAADCEIHRSDGQLYLIDSARLFPPTAPDARRPREVFFKLFRSEFLSWYARNEPLSSDAFSAFAAPADQIEQNRRVMQATLSLFRDRIPEVAEMLEALPVSGRVTGADLTRLVQQYGVNVRFLGRIRKECTSQWLRDALGMEMAARAAAKHLQRLMRESRGSSAVPFLQLAVTTFNELRTGEPPWLRPDVAAKFGADTIADVDTLSCRCRRLVARVGVLAGVEILSQGLSDQVDHVTLSDLRLVSRVKELSYSQIAHAESLRLESKLRPPSSQRRVALLLQARDVLMRELCSNPRDQLLRSRYARVLLNLCKHGGGGEHCDALENNLVHMNVAQVDVFYARSKLLRLRFLRELEADNVTLAVQHYLQVSDTLKSMLSGAQNWAVIEVASYVSKLEQLKVRVLTQDPLAIVRRSRDPTVVLQISSCGAVIRQEFERLVNAAPNGPEVSRFFAACLTLGLCTAADFSASVNSRSVCLGLTDAVGGLMGPLIGHVRELTLPNACLSHEAFALLLSSAPLLESLTARALFGVTIDFPFPPQLKRAQLADALVAPEWRPPATLEELRLSACYTRHGRFDNEMPEGLKVLWLPGNVLLTAAVMLQLPRGLRVLRGSRVETGAWPALNDSCAASLVELQFGNTDPSLATVSMPLLEAFDGGPLTAEEVLLNVVKSPALRKLAICGSPMMDEAAYRVLVQCPRLEDLDCSFNAHFTSASVVAALQKNGARLRRLAAKDSWGLRDLHLIVAPEMEMLRVYLDRQPFMFGEHLRDLRLEDLEGFDETKLSGLYRLERLTVSTCPISAEVLRGLLVSSCASLQRLELCNLIGKFDFELPELAVLRTLIVKNSFREAGLRMLAKTPALERLELENAFEAELFSDASVVASLPWLRRLSVVSAGSNLQDTNGVLRRLTRLERLEIGLALTVLGTVVGHSLPPFLRRVKLIAREMTLPHTLIEAFAKCQLLAQLIFPRSVLTVSQQIALVGASVCDLVFCTEDLDAEAMGRLRQLRRLRRLLVHHPMAVQAIAQDEFEPFVERTPRGQEEEHMALLTQGVMNDSTRALMLGWIGDEPSKKEKWAFCFFWGDEFSLVLMMELAHRGYRMIVATVGEAMQLDTSRWVCQLMEECGAAHFFPYDMDDSTGLRAFVEKLTPRLDCAVVVCPSRMDLPQAGAMLRSFSLGTKVSSWHHFEDWILTRPMVALAALSGALERTPGARVGFWGSPLASISENLAGGFVPMRAAFAGLAAAVRSLSISMPAAIVTAIFPGIFAPGTKVPGAVSARDAAHNYLSALFRAEPSHSGRFIRYTMEVIVQ